MHNCLIIAYEKSTVKSIEKVLEDFPEFNYIGNTFDYDQSMDIVLKQMPDLIFLDMDNTLEDPFVFIKDIADYLDSDVEFIAISSSKEKAYESIKHNFFDYLLKPLKDIDIRKSTLRFKKKHSTKLKKTICLKSYRDYHYLNTDEILFLKADNNTTDFYMIDGRTISAYKTLKTYEKMLPKNFLRIHKSYMINRNHVTRVNHGRNRCTLKQHEEKIPFTKTYSDNIDHMMKSLSASTLQSLN